MVCFYGCCTLLTRHLPNHRPSSPRLSPLSFPFLPPSAPGAGNGLFTSQRGHEKKTRKAKAVQAHEGGITGSPILDFKLPRHQEKENPGRPTDRMPQCKEKAVSGIRHSSYVAKLLSCCLPLPRLKHDPYKPPPFVHLSPLGRRVHGGGESLEEADD